jgi:hypothetical protein
MDEGHIVVDSIAEIEMADITDELARESGFTSAEDLLETASHGPGKNVYLIRFHYLPPGAWDAKPASRAVREEGTTLLQRIGRSKSPTLRRARKNGAATTPRRRRKG